MQQKRFTIKQTMNKLKNRLKKIQEIKLHKITRLRTSMRNSIGTRVLVNFLFMVIFAVLIVGISSYYLSNRLIENKVREASEQTIVQAGRKLDYILERYHYRVNELVLNNDFINNLSAFNDYGSADGKVDQMLKLNQLRQILSRTALADEHLQLHLINLEHDVIVSPEYLGDSGEEAILNSTWYQEAADSHISTIWIGGGPKLGEEEKETPSYTVKFAKIFINGRQKYILLYELSTKLFEENFADISFGENGLVKIVDANNQVVFSFDDREIGKENNYPIQLDREVHSFENNGELIFQYQPDSTEWYLVGAVNAKELTKDTQVIMYITAGIMLLAILVSLLTGRRVARMVGVPLGEISSLMAAAEKGDLNVRSELANRQDEIGILAASFNQMLAKIAEMMKETRRASLKVLEVSTELTEISRFQLETAKEVAAASEEISSGAMNLTEKAENGSQLAGNIHNEVENVFRINKEMENYARKIQKDSQIGVQKMDELVEQTKLIEQMTETLREKTDVLSSSTNQINEIVTILNNIATQTNLLALNAAIEAARAGDAGRGFAVVADEIRKLSSQSRESIESVGQITSGIIQNINETLQLLEEATPIFIEQVGKATETHEILNQVEAHMDEYMENIAHVSRSIEQLVASQEHLAETINDVSATAQESSAISEELTAQTEEQTGMSDSLVSRANELKQLSENLQKLLDNFKV